MTRALVLSGGALVGMAWETGLLSGLAEGGGDLASADFILGTAAGAALGWQLASGHSATSLAEAILAEPPVPPLVVSEQQPSGSSRLPELLSKAQRELSAGQEATEVLREVGALALTAKTMDESTFRATLGRSLAAGDSESWPANFACTAINAQTGEMVVWNAESRIALAQGVFASCSVPGVHPPVTIDGRRYISGAMRSVSNSDLAAGHDIVAVVCVRVPYDDSALTERMRLSLEAELQHLRKSGARVELLAPDIASMATFGVKPADLMDPNLRPAACKAGMAQGKALAASFKRAWH